MSLYINGIKFEQDVIAFPVDDDFTFDRSTVANSAYPRTYKGPREKQSMKIIVPLIGPNNMADGERLMGMADQEQFLLLESDVQDIVGSERAVYGKVTSIKQGPVPGVPTLLNIEMDVEIVGIPILSGGQARRAAFVSGEFSPQEDDIAYFALTDASRKGLTPTKSDEGISWSARSTSDWTDMRGTWRVLRNEFGDWTIQNTNSSSGDYWSIWTGNTTIADGVVQALVRPRGNTAGIAFRIQGTATNTTGYVAYITTTQVVLSKRTGDNTYTTLVSASYTPKKNNFVSLAVKMQGTSIQVMLDGIVYLSTTDATHSTGRIALHTTHATTTNPEWRNILATKSPMPRVTMVVNSRDGSPYNFLGNSTYAVRGSENIITAGDFEGTANWTNVGLTTFTTQSTTRIAGNKAAQVTGGGNLQQVFPVTPGRDYILSVWGQTALGNTITLTAAPLDGSGETISLIGINTAVGANLWGHHDVIITPGNFKDSTQYIMKLVSGSGDVYWDNARIREASRIVLTPTGRRVEYMDAMVSAPVTTVELMGVSGPAVSETELSP